MAACSWPRPRRRPLGGDARGRVLQGDMGRRVGAPPGHRRAARGLRSAQDEPAAGTPRCWALDFQHVTVVNSTALRIALRQVAFYQIDEPETITARIPASAHASDLPVVASPQIVIRATPGSVVCGGSFAAAPTEAAIAGAGATPGTLRLTLQRDSRSPSIVSAAALHAADSARGCRRPSAPPCTRSSRGSSPTRASPRAGPR